MACSRTLQGTDTTPILTLAVVEVTTPVTKVPTPAQVQRARAIEAWNSLRSGQKFTWRAYASHLRRYCPRRRRVVGPSPRACFIKVCLQRWSMDVDLGTPLFAPEVFRGDNIGVFALPRRQSQAPINISASAPNSEGTLTEILIQKVTDIDKTMRPRSMRTLSLMRFTPCGMQMTLELPRGKYILGARFIDSESLQMTEIQEIGRVTVERKRRKRVSSPAPQAATTFALL